MFAAVSNFFIYNINDFFYSICIKCSFYSVLWIGLTKCAKYNTVGVKIFLLLYLAVLFYIA
jgi:hypothetical protein